MIRTVWWEDHRIKMIDQRALPGEERYVSCHHYREVIQAISDLTIRGAPAIGVAAALGIALGARDLALAEGEEFDRGLEQICEEFARARPTARNLFWAIEQMKGLNATLKGRANEEKIARLTDRAISIAQEDLDNNIRLGRHGQTLIPPGASLLTICNAGALATAGWGTALGIIRAAQEAGKAPRVFACETRPVLQGARLTAWELKKENIPVTLITDNMAGFLMYRGKIDCVIVGADRIVAGGDVVNKIGTYTLALLARAHGIPFYVAAPRSTFDLSLQRGEEVIIEERPVDEVLTIQGKRVAPEGIEVYNPAFDITPAAYVTAIVTEKGIISPVDRDTIARIMAE